MSGPIGKPTPYIDGVEKVRGQAMYTDDYKLPNMLYLTFLRSTESHAKIKSLDISSAKSYPGVVAVATGKDIPVSFGILPISPDETAMAVEKVRYNGEIVAAVAGKTVEAAQEAVKNIKVEYESITAFTDPHDSLEKCNLEEQIHPHTKDGKNIHKTAELRFNEPEKELETAK